MDRLRYLKSLVTGLLVMTVCVMAAGAFTDTQGHPSEAAIHKWSAEYGLISGYKDGAFRPNDSITKGAFAGILDRMMRFPDKSKPSAFRDIEGSYWADAILKANAYSIMMGSNGYAEPCAPITRQQAVTMIVRAFDFPADAIFPHYIDDVNIAGYARSAVSEMTERGYLEGVADDYFRPDDPITRADVVRIFDNMISVMVQDDAPLSRNVNGNILINSESGAVLRDMRVTGDLYVAPGVKGSVILENVTISGETRNFSRAASVEVRENAEDSYRVQTVTDDIRFVDSAGIADPGETTPAPSDNGETSATLSDNDETSATLSDSVTPDEMNAALSDGVEPDEMTAALSDGVEPDEMAAPPSDGVEPDEMTAAPSDNETPAVAPFDSGETSPAPVAPSDSGETPDSAPVEPESRDAQTVDNSVRAVDSAKVSKTKSYADPGETTAVAGTVTPSGGGTSAYNPERTTPDSDQALYGPGSAGTAPGSSDPGRTAEAITPSPDSDQSLYAPVQPSGNPPAPNSDPGETTYDPGRAVRPVDNGATTDSGKTADTGNTSASAAAPDSGLYDTGRTTKSGRHIMTRDPSKAANPPAATVDPGNTTDSGRTTDSGKTADTGRTYSVSGDPGETTAPVTPSNGGAASDSGRTENPENQAPVNTPSRPSTPSASENPENQIPTNTPYVPSAPSVPANTNYGTLPNKPVSQWTIRDVYTPGTKTGQYFTYQGSRIPIYAGVRTRNVYSGEFVWRTGHRLRYLGTRYDAKFGVDVSAYQNRDRSNGTINWAAAKADGVQFAMIRVGLRGTSTGALREDAYYARNIDGAMAQGIQTGVYIFAQAKTIAEAVEEADFVIARLRGHKINGPVSYDWEMKDSSYRVYGTSPEMATACAVAFC